MGKKKTKRCKICKKLIFNRGKNAIFCKDCSEKEKLRQKRECFKRYKMRKK